MSLLRTRHNISNIPTEWVDRTIRWLHFTEAQRLGTSPYPRNSNLQPGEKSFMEGYLDDFFKQYNYTTHVIISTGASWTRRSQATESGMMAHLPLFLNRVENLVLEAKIKYGVFEMDGITRVVQALAQYPRLRVVQVNLYLPKDWVNADEARFYGYCLGHFASKRGWTIEVSCVWVDHASRLVEWLSQQQQDSGFARLARV